MKRNRQAKILELIRENDIESQEELTALLEKSGFTVNQSTISRDISELSIVKIRIGRNRYKYKYSGADSNWNKNEKLRSIFSDSVISVDVAGNIVVVKTPPGLASAACAAIDSMNFPSLVGTIAGDDTAFLALKSCEAAEELADVINAMI